MTNHLKRNAMLIDGAIDDVGREDRPDFQKVPVLNALAPTQSELPFVVTEVLVPILFVGLTAIAIIRFRPDQPRVAALGA